MTTKRGPRGSKGSGREKAGEPKEPLHDRKAAYDRLVEVREESEVVDTLLECARIGEWVWREVKRLRPLYLQRKEIQKTLERQYSANPDLFSSPPKLDDVLKLPTLERIAEDAPKVSHFGQVVGAFFLCVLQELLRELITERDSDIQDLKAAGIIIEIVTRLSYVRRPSEAELTLISVAAGLERPTSSPDEEAKRRDLWGSRKSPKINDKLTRLFRAASRTFEANSPPAMVAAFKVHLAMGFEVPKAEKRPRHRPRS